MNGQKSFGLVDWLGDWRRCAGNEKVHNTGDMKRTRGKGELDSSEVVSGIVSTITILERCIRKEVGESNAELWMV